MNMNYYEYVVGQHLELLPCVNTFITDLIKKQTDTLLHLLQTSIFQKSHK